MGMWNRAWLQLICPHVMRLKHFCKASMSQTVLATRMILCNLMIHHLEVATQRCVHNIELENLQARDNVVKTKPQFPGHVILRSCRRSEVTNLELLVHKETAVRPNL